MKSSKKLFIKYIRDPKKLTNKQFNKRNKKVRDARAREKAIENIVWNTKGKSRSEKNRLFKERIKKNFRSSARNVKNTALRMGKSVSQKAYQQGKEIYNEQERKGGFYNLAKKTNVNLRLKRKVKYVYLKPKKRHRNKIKVKRIKQRIRSSSYDSSNPFGLSI